MAPWPKKMERHIASRGERFDQDATEDVTYNLSGKVAIPAPVPNRFA